MKYLFNFAKKSKIIKNETLDNSVTFNFYYTFDIFTLWGRVVAQFSKHFLLSKIFKRLSRLREIFCNFIREKKMFIVNGLAVILKINFSQYLDAYHRTYSRPSINWIYANYELR